MTIVKFIVAMMCLASLFITVSAKAEPTVAEVDQALEVVITRILGDPDLLEAVVNLPAEIRLAFIVELAVEELVMMENEERGENHGRSQKEIHI